MKVKVKIAILGEGDFIEKVTSEGAKEVSHVDIWEKRIPRRRNSKFKVLVGNYLM